MARRTERIVIDGERLTPEQVEAIADGAACRLAAAAVRRTRESRRVVERAAGSGQTVYGLNTGFGELADVRIPDDRLEQLQLNLVRSHSVGVGTPLPERTVRAVLALRAHCLARGHSGIRVATLERLVELLEHRLHPVIPERGSVCASGDLAPLAHLALTLVGEGELLREGRRGPAAPALERAGLEPLRLGVKEGLALINGTQVALAVGVLTLVRAERLARVADVAGAMSLEALRGSHRAFDSRIQRARPHPGQRASAATLRRLLRRSQIERSHAGCGRVQDAYSLRCMPQVHGAVRDGLDHVRRVLQIEIDSSTDNPMVFVEQGELRSGGNFHGQPVSLALDHLAIATCSLGTIAERRIERLLNPQLSGLPPFLAGDPGLDSGFMMAQVTAAALVSENKTLAHPASVDTIPTSAAKEDHVSMGMHAALKAERIVDNVETVLAVELLCAAQALDLLAPLAAGVGAEAARRTVRAAVPALESDRVLSGDLELARGLIASGELLAAVESAAGRLR